MRSASRPGTSAPHVDSAVVRLDRRSDGPGAAERPQVARVVDAAFAQRRKTIRNSMAASGFPKDELDRALAAAGIAGTVRAEALEPADFIGLARALGSCGDGAGKAAR